MKFQRIPAGSFFMGSNETKEQLEAAGFAVPYDVSDESPQHRVTISQEFHMGIHEVTRGQFAAFVRATGYKTDAEKDGVGGWGYNAKTKGSEQKPEYHWQNTGFPQTDDHPVVNVSWNDARAFYEWLSGTERVPYRLATEAEWEYACRAGTTTRYSTGNDASSLQGYANVQDTSFDSKFPGLDFAKYPSFSFNDRHSFTAPVGSFKANGFGLYDMHGNVLEWCQDDSRKYQDREMVDPNFVFERSDRVSRGGGWHSAPVDVRSSHRSRLVAGGRNFFLGFRLVRSSSE